MDELSTRLLDSTQLERLTGGGRQAELLRELAPRGAEGVLVRFMLALRKRPSARIATPPERATCVHEQHFQAPLAPAEQQKPGAQPRHFTLLFAALVRARDYRA
jgi:hypothetical protein